MAQNLPKSFVSRRDQGLPVTEKISFGKGLTFVNDPDATDPPSDDTALNTGSNNLQSAHDVRQTNPSKANTANEKVKNNILTAMLDDDAAYVERVANKVAKDAGDVEAGYAVVTRIGFLLAGKGGGNRIIGFCASGPGWAQAHEAKGRKGYEGHVWKVGITEKKATPPPNTVQIFNLEADIIFNNLPSGTILAYCHASVAPVNAKSNPGGNTAPAGTNLSKSAIAKNKQKRFTVDITSENIYAFGAWRYITIP